MIPVSTCKGRRIAVFGLGGSGLTTARALAAGGAVVTADDDSPERRQAAAEAGISVARLDEEALARLDALVLSPGVPLTHPEPHWSVRLAEAHGVPVIGDIELFCRERQARGGRGVLVAVTGTNGKSTTTALIGHLLARAGRRPEVGGNIGTAILDLAPPTDSSCHVIECSSYQIDLAPSLAPSVGVLLNVTPDHIDRHGTFSNYAAIKQRLVAASEIAVVGVDDAVGRETANLLEGRGRRVVRISSGPELETGIAFRPPNLVETGRGAARPVADLSGIGSLRGNHNAQNAAAAFAVCAALGLARGEIEQGLRSFPGLAHRMEQIGKIGHVLFVNDSKATNAEAAERALASFERIYWLVGGRQKDGGVRSLIRFAPRIARAYLFGEAQDDFERTLTGHCPVMACGDLVTATRAAYADARSDPAGEPVVLLSPACASFDQFANFERRGDAFRAAVDALQARTPDKEVCP